VSCYGEAAEPIDLPFVLCTTTRVGRRKHKFNRIRQVAPMCPHGRAHWPHLANTIEPSVCGSDAFLCQITLTTCSNFGSRILPVRRFSVAVHCHPDDLNIVNLAPRHGCDETNRSDVRVKRRPLHNNLWLHSAPSFYRMRF